MFRIRVERLINKRIEEVFESISDHATYKRFPGINDSRLIEEGREEKNGQGALRIIIAAPIEFRERITLFERPHKMHYLIESTSPLPVEHEIGHIHLKAIGQRTRVTWISEGRIAVPVLGRALDKVAEIQASRVFEGILKAIENE